MLGEFGVGGLLVVAGVDAGDFGAEPFEAVTFDRGADLAAGEGSQRDYDGGGDDDGRWFDDVLSGDDALWDVRFQGSHGLAFTWGGVRRGPGVGVVGAAGCLALY